MTSSGKELRELHKRKLNMSTQTLATRKSRGGNSIVSNLYVQRIATLLLIFTVWELAIVAGVVPAITPSILEIAASITTAVVDSNFWFALGHTLYAASLGWIISCIVGVILGLFIGTIRPLYLSTSLIVEFGRAFPTIALMPVVMLLLGATLNMKVTLVVLSAVWPILVQSIQGARRLDPGIVATARVFQIPRSLWFRKVLLPASMPFVVTGIRISASISILSAVGVEVLTQVPGLGRLITLAQEAARWDNAFAYLFFAGVFGWLIAALLAKGEQRILAWNRRSDD